MRVSNCIMCHEEFFQRRSHHHLCNSCVNAYREGHIELTADGAIRQRQKRLGMGPEEFEFRMRASERRCAV